MVLLTLVFVFFVIVQIVYFMESFFLHSCTFKLLGKKIVEFYLLSGILYLVI